MSAATSSRAAARCAHDPEASSDSNAQALLQPGPPAHWRGSALRLVAAAGAAAALLVLGAAATFMARASAIHEPGRSSRRSSSRSLDATLRLKSAGTSASVPPAPASDDGASPGGPGGSQPTRALAHPTPPEALAGEEATTTPASEETTGAWFEGRLEGEPCGWWGSASTYQGECAPGLRCAPPRAAPPGEPNACVADGGTAQEEDGISGDSKRELLDASPTSSAAKKHLFRSPGASGRAAGTANHPTIQALAWMVGLPRPTIQASPPARAKA